MPSGEVGGSVGASSSSSRGGPTPRDDCAGGDEEFAAVERRARVALEAVAVRDADAEAHMDAYVAALLEYRRACHCRGLYREADLVQQVLRNLRLEAESRHVRGLSEQQMSERRALEEAHRLEFRRFHAEWNARIDAFEEDQLAAEVALLERQNSEVEAFHEEMRGASPALPRYSRKLLDARGREHALAGQLDYVRAEHVRRQADALEAQHQRRYADARVELYVRRGLNLRQRHQQELLVLRNRVEGRRLALERARKRDLDEVLQRYLNARSELETQQNIVRNKTGALLLKHSCNTRSEKSGADALLESALSGTFGAVVKQRHQQERREAAAAGRSSEP